MGNDEILLRGYCQMYPSKQTAICGHKKPNAWGLHDVHGNVQEQCADLFDTTGFSYVSRGGSWEELAVDSKDEEWDCRATSRMTSFSPTSGTSNVGFRLALSPSVRQPESVNEKK